MKQAQLVKSIRSPFFLRKFVAGSGLDAVKSAMSLRYSDRVSAKRSTNATRGQPMSFSGQASTCILFDMERAESGIHFRGLRLCSSLAEPDSLPLLLSPAVDAPEILGARIWFRQLERLVIAIRAGHEYLVSVGL